MKKIRTVFACTILMLVLLLTSCMKENTSDNSIVCTIAPIYSFTNELVKDTDANVSLLIANGSDVHSYQPSAKDITTVYNAKLFIYVGGESDAWVVDALENSRKTNPNRIEINLMEILKDYIKEEEALPGMESEDEGEIEYDEHIWLSLKNAKICVNEIADALLSLGLDEALINTNKTNYINELDTLDKKFEKLVSTSSVNTLLFADRFPFRYFVDDYNLNYYAAFVGCSTETNASVQTITFLASKLDELNLKYVIALENSDCSIANAVINASKSKNQEIIILNSLQHITLKDLNNGVSYLSLMEYNYDKLSIILK